MTLDSWTTILFPVLSGLIGSFATYFWQQKSKRDEAILRYKEERYTGLLLSTSGFFRGTASAEQRGRFLEERVKAWLYCSDDVSRAMNEFLELSIKKSDDIDCASRAIGNIVIAVRKDLGRNTRLKCTDFFIYAPGR